MVVISFVSSLGLTAGLLAQPPGPAEEGEAERDKTEQPDPDKPEGTQKERQEPEPEQQPGDEPGADEGQGAGQAEADQPEQDPGAEPPADEPVAASEEQPAAEEQQSAPGEEPALAEQAQEPSADQQEQEAGWGEEEFFSDQDEIGFGEGEPTEVEEPTQPPASSLTLDGFFRSQEALWVERFKDNPFAKARQNLDLDLRYKRPFQISDDTVVLRLAAGLHLEYDFAYLHERDSYDEATLDEYEWQVIGRETYAALSYDVLELTFGRQIVAWGQGIVFSPIDVVNPRDRRELYLVDIEDMRMAVLASRVGLFIGEHRLEGMIIHESYFGLKPPPLAPFNPFRNLILDNPLVAELPAGVFEEKTLRFKDVPNRFVNQAGQFLGRWSYTGHGFDLSLYAASVLESQGIARLPEPSQYLQNEIDLELWHPRYTMLGHSGAVPVEDFTLRWELGLDLDRPFSTSDSRDELFNVQMQRYHQIFAMLGATYRGIDDTTILFEYEQHYVLDNPERDDNSTLELLFPVEQPQLMLRGEHLMMHERLSITAMAILLGIWDYTGWLARAEILYEIWDAFKVGAGYITYHPTDDVSTIYGFEDHDWLYATFRWDFLLE